MKGLETTISYAVRAVVLAGVGFIAITGGLIWLGVSPVRLRLDEIGPAVLWGSAVLALMLWVVECFTRPNPTRRWARLIDTFLALGWLVGIWILTTISISMAVP